LVSPTAWAKKATPVAYPVIRPRCSTVAVLAAIASQLVAAIGAMHGMTDAVAGREVRHGGTPDIVAEKM
jgi:hypothetical protein